MINETFSQYDYIPEWQYFDELKIQGRTILHIYPHKDTINDKNDDMTGYVDALEFVLKVFDVKNRKCYETYCDSICFLDKIQTSIRVFKDQSTMVIIDEPCQIHQGHSVTIRQPN